MSMFHLIPIEKRRKAALASRDGVAYAQLCDELGIVDIEDRHLFEQGANELELIAEQQKETENVSRDEGRYTPVMPVKTNSPVRSVQQALSLESQAGNYTKPKKATERSTRPSVVYDRGNEYGLNPDNIFRDVSDKRNILIEAGYKSAYVGKGRKIPLSNASDDRIGQMFKKVYNQERAVRLSAAK